MQQFCGLQPPVYTMCMVSHKGQSSRPDLMVQAIWPGVIQRHGGEVDAKFDISTLAHISDGYSSGTIDQVRKWHCNTDTQPAMSSFAFISLSCTCRAHNAI